MKTIKTAQYEKLNEYDMEGELNEGLPKKPNPLDGKSNVQARRIANKIIPDVSGFYSDQSWEGVKKIWDAFDAAGLSWGIMDNKYLKEEGSVLPYAKEWKVEINFTNNKGRETILYGIVTASGAGSVEDPLSRYDITAYIN